MITVQEVIGANGLRTNAIVCPQCEIKYVIFAKEMYDLLLDIETDSLTEADQIKYFEIMKQIHSRDERFCF
jgi:acetyl-CoA carboxylase beta subunit